MVDLVKLVLEFIKDAGKTVVIAWGALLLAVWLVYFYRQDPLTGTPFKGAALFCGVAAWGGVTSWRFAWGRLKPTTVDSSAGEAGHKGTKQRVKKGPRKRREA